MSCKGSHDRSGPSEGLSFNICKYASMLVELRLIYVVELSSAVVMSGCGGYLRPHKMSLISNLAM